MSFKDLVEVIIGRVDTLFTVLLALTFVFFLFHLAKYIAKSGEEDSRSESRNYMVYAVIGLFCIVAFWGILRFFDGVFGTPTGIPRVTPNDMVDE